MTTLTQAEALQLFIYDQDTGVLIWKKSEKTAGYVNTGDGYITVMVGGKNYKAHRIAWLMTYGYWPNQVDHIDHDRINNRIANLREVCQQENSRNMSLRGTNTSGHVGVSWHKKANKWAASITIDYKARHLGLFSNFEDAVLARKEASDNYKFHKNHGN